MAQFVDLENIDSFDMLEGVVGRPLFGDDVMLNLVTCEPGALVPLHSHPNEQLGLIIEGELVFTVDGEDHSLTRGYAFQFPGQLEHAARAGPEGCTALDVFAPPREDYRELASAQGLATDSRD